MKNNKGQNTMTEKVDNITYALVKQNDGSLKKVNYEEYKQEKALENLKKVALSGGNIFAELMSCVRVASLGQITHALYEVGGRYRRNM